MIITAYRDGRQTIVALRRRSAVVPLAEAEEFWSDPYGALSSSSDRAGGRDTNGLTFVPAVRPSAKILCVGLNYQAHAEEGIGVVPKYPTIFGRWTSSLSASEAFVSVPPGEPGLDWEGELAAVIGQELWQARPADVQRAVFGFAPFNDLTARNAQKLSTQWTLGKNVDGSGAIGDIITADEVGDISMGLTLTTRVNGQTVQQASTREMIFSIDELLRFISETIRLLPGDVLTTGTPSGVGYVRKPPWLLVPGDFVEVEIERIGLVRSRLTDTSDSASVMRPLQVTS